MVTGYITNSTPRFISSFVKQLNKLNREFQANEE